MAQAAHAISQFHLEYPEETKRWNNNYLISLSIDTEKKLQTLLTKLNDVGVSVSYFTEPDIGDELTSICFIETPETIRLTSHLPLFLINYN
jgi:hypothetical protein